MVSPLAKGLFQKAICESGGGRANGPMAAPTLKAAEAAGLALGKLAGIPGDDAAALAALRKLPAADLVRGMNLINMGQQRETYAGPMIDGKIVPEPVEDAFRAGRQAKIAYMIGANNREFGFFTPPAAMVDGMLARFGPDKEKVPAAYGTEDKSEIGVGLSSDGAMVEPARMLARFTAQAGQPTWVYRFSYVASSLRATTKGALHATEIPFVFATVRAKYAEATTPEDEALGAQANAYWAAFAKNGDPNAQGLPRWPAFTAAGDVVMDLGAPAPKAGPDPWKARLDLVEKAASSPQPPPTR
jgi:para-nitrobenzyl esterase